MDPGWAAMARRGWTIRHHLRNRSRDMVPGAIPMGWRTDLLPSYRSRLPGRLPTAKPPGVSRIDRRPRRPRHPLYRRPRDRDERKEAMNRKMTVTAQALRAWLGIPPSWNISLGLPVGARVDGEENVILYVDVEIPTACEGALIGPQPWKRVHCNGCAETASLGE